MAREEKVKKIKLETGTVYQNEPGGSFYFRYQINGSRKCVALKTKSEAEAVEKAKETLPIVKGRTIDVISAHVKEARGLTEKKMALPLSGIWDVYSNHPDRATPATMHEQTSYHATLDEFIAFCKDSSRDIQAITPEVADRFAKYLQKTDISVDTHNRKIRRLRRIFKALSSYFSGDNPFRAASLFRKYREEQGTRLHRKSFTREQEHELLKVLLNPKFRVMNKLEIRVIYHLGMFTGQRLKDCVLLQWQNIDMIKKRIWVKQFKTGKEVTIPMAAPLYEVLLEARAWQENEYVCPKTAARYNKTDADGKNTGNNLVDLDVLRVIRWIGVEPSVKVPGRKKSVTVYGFHALRHSFCSYCAEAGVPKAVLLSILGTDSEIADKYYTHIGDEAQEKAIAAISKGIALPVADTQIQNALAILKEAPNSKELLEQLKKSLEQK